MAKKISCWNPTNKTYKCECINFYFILNKKFTDDITDDINIEIQTYQINDETAPNIYHIGFATLQKGYLKVGPLSFCNNKTIVNNKLYIRFNIGDPDPDTESNYIIKLNGSCNYNINLKYDNGRIISDANFLTEYET